MGKIVQVDKLDNGYWQITVLDPVTQTQNKIRDMQFYQVSNKNINLKNYPYSSLDNKYLYFDKSYTPKFIAQLIYLYSTYAYTNGILDKDVNKISRQLNEQGLTMTKYGISQINDNTILPCISIDPNPKELEFKCLSDDGTVIENTDVPLYNYWYIKDILNLGNTKITVSLWNFSYIVFGAMSIFIIITLFVLRTDKI
jgi:hypothetical protein